MTHTTQPFQQTWWEKNLENQMGEFRLWIGDYKAESKVFCRKYIASKGYKSILDCGCGVCTEYYGYKNDGYPIEYKGVDATPKLVALGLKNGIDVVEGYLEALPAADASVDVCYIRHILEHLPYYGDAINEAMRVAAKEVVICWFIKPDDQPDLVNYDATNNLYHNRYNIDGVLNLIQAHPRFESCETQDINAQESLFKIKLKPSLDRPTGAALGRSGSL